LYRVLAAAVVARVADQEPAWELVGVQLLTQAPAVAVALVTLAWAAMAVRVLLLYVIQTHTVILLQPAASSLILAAIKL